MNIETLFFQQLDTHSATIVALSFAGGIVSSILPCAVVMLPILVGYVGGYSELSKARLLRQILLFMLGFALVLTMLGMVAGILGVAMGAMVGDGWYYLLGAIAIVMGLQLLDVIHLPMPQFVTRLPAVESSGGWLAPLLLGIAFGAATSPCGTPFLTGILALISRESNWLLGGVSLFAYALGQSMLLLAVGLFAGLVKRMALIRRVGVVITRLSAIVFILAGLRLIAQAAGWLDPFAFME